MKAITRTRYGSPDVLGFDDVDAPTPATGQVLVRVDAASVNRGDALEIRGWPLLARLSYGARRPKRPVPGTDLAGTVVAVGDGVEGLSVGQDVVGWGEGSFAELAVADAGAVRPRPAGLPAVEAAAVPTAAVAAHQAVHDAGRVAAGHRVLVLGASGAVGTFAVQLAAAEGARVTAVAGAHHADRMRALGADGVVDYRAEDVTTHHGRYDVVVDTVGTLPLGALTRTLTPTGTLVVVGSPNAHSLTGMGRFAGAAARSLVNRRRIVPLFSKPDAEALAAVLDRVAAGAVRPVVAATFDLSDAAQALRRVESGHAGGKVVLVAR